MDKVAALERGLMAGLYPLRDHPAVGEVRVLGGVGVVELVSNKQTKSAGGYLDDIGPRLTAAFLDRGLLLRPLGHVLYVMPPYVISPAEIEWVTTQVGEVVDQVVR
jgi:adenosylmethionine-8-amino-7-oxononanoate aminotransferase